MEPAAAPAPAPANKYANGKIYKIINNFTNKIYIGSTCTMLAKRHYQHKMGFKLYQNGKAAYVSSYDILSLGESDIVLIEEFPCMNKDQLYARERYHIEVNNCINKVIPTKTASNTAEYREPEKITEHHQPTKAEIAERREQAKAKIAERREQAKAKIAERREQAKAKIAERREQAKAPITAAYTRRAIDAYYERVKHTESFKDKCRAKSNAYNMRQRAKKAELTAEVDAIMNIQFPT